MRRVRPVGPPLDGPRHPLPSTLRISPIAGALLLGWEAPWPQDHDGTCSFLLGFAFGFRHFCVLPKKKAADLSTTRYNWMLRICKFESQAAGAWFSWHLEGGLNSKPLLLVGLTWHGLGHHNFVPLQRFQKVFNPQVFDVLPLARTLQEPLGCANHTRHHRLLSPFHLGLFPWQPAPSVEYIHIYIYQRELCVLSLKSYITSTHLFSPPETAFSHESSIELQLAYLVVVDSVHKLLEGNRYNRNEATESAEWSLRNMWKDTPNNWRGGISDSRSTSFSVLICFASDLYWVWILTHIFTVYTYWRHIVIAKSFYYTFYEYLC